MGDFIENYLEIKNARSFNLRSILRLLALASLSFKESAFGNKAYLNTPRIQFLYIHHSFKDELHNLEKLLERLSKYFTFISYSDAVTKVLNNKIDKPYLSFSSDDGFKNNLYAAEILNKHGAKACFFINPGLIEEKDFNKIRGHCRQKLHLPPIEFLNWNDISTLVSQGHEIGAHTMFHDNIVEMNKEEMEEDMQQTFEIISSRCGTVKHFAFPYGRFFHFNEEGRKAVFKAGYVSCASAERGCHINTIQSLEYDQLCIRRDHIILDWNINHIMYFLANNARKKSEQNNKFPF